MFIIVPLIRLFASLEHIQPSHFDCSSQTPISVLARLVSDFYILVILSVLMSFDPASVLNLVIADFFHDKDYPSDFEAFTSKKLKSISNISNL